MKIQTRIYSRRLPESIQNAISLDIIQVKNFKTFMERPSLVVILCLRQWHIFKRWGVFQRSKGRGHEKFSRGQAPGPPFLLASLALRLSPPNINFRSDGPGALLPTPATIASLKEWQSKISTKMSHIFSRPILLASQEKTVSSFSVAGT